MMNRKISSLLVLAGAAILLTSTASSQLSGADVSVGPGQNYSGSGTAGSVGAAGGNVTNANVTVETITNKWAAFYGQLDSQERLADSSGNNFYQWAATDATTTGSNIYAVPTGSATPSSLTTVGTPSNLLGAELTGGGDGGDNTFNESLDVTGAGSTAAAETFVSGSPGTAFTVGLYENGNDAGQPVYAAEVTPDTSGFNSNSLDFQLLVGVGESTATQSFDFYAEIG